MIQYGVYGTPRASSIARRSAWLVSATLVSCSYPYANRWSRSVRVAAGLRSAVSVR